MKDERPFLISERRRLTLPTKSIDQWPTNVMLEAIHVLPSVYSVDVPFDQQTTQILPAIDTSNKIEALKTPASTENYVSLVQKLVKSSGIYALASFASPLTSLVLSPFLTRNLSHADFGALTVFNTLIALIAGI